jgi:glycosyltransferase involved in cell wall biosynthesis
MWRAPHTTVIIPVFNGEAYLAAAVTSVLCQLDDGDQVLVIDDCSTDGTRSIVQAYQPRVTLLQGPGTGPSAARNAGLAAATGDYVAFLDHDDKWPHDRHRTLLAALRANAAADTAVGRIRLRVEASGDGSRFAGFDGMHDASILMSCLYRRQLIDRVGPFNERLRFGEDTEYYCRLVGAGMTPVLCDADALIYRRHGSNITNSAPDRMIVTTDILAEHLARRRGQR